MTESWRRWARASDLFPFPLDPAHDAVVAPIRTAPHDPPVFGRSACFLADRRLITRLSLLGPMQLPARSGERLLNRVGNEGESLHSKRRGISQLEIRMDDSPVGPEDGQRSP
jgi:hypothetical protein